AAFELKRVFPPGYLGRALLRAIRREQLVRQFSDPASRSIGPIPEGDDGPEPTVLLIDGRVAAWTPPAVRYLEDSGAAPPRLAAALERALARPSASLPTGDTPTLRVGECLLTRAGGRKESVQYVARGVGAADLRRTLVFFGLSSPGTADAAIEMSHRRVGPPGPGSPALDPVAWAQLEELAGTNDRFLPELAEAFLDHAPELLRELQRTSSAGDPVALARAAHALKSTSSQVGALHLAELCRLVEEAPRGSNSSAAGVSEVGAEFDCVAAALRAVTKRPE
ncbi:MAG TPA: Hpt domain-containing protein, partial [Thermoplasmata archaeon]|nr:Hpt domain-containing protein [Thermoplasmata archaeon]